MSPTFLLSFVVRRQVNVCDLDRVTLAFLTKG